MQLGTSNLGSLRNIRRRLFFSGKAGGKSETTRKSEGKSETTGSSKSMSGFLSKLPGMTRAKPEVRSKTSKLEVYYSTPQSEAPPHQDPPVSESSELSSEPSESSGPIWQTESKKQRLAAGSPPKGWGYGTPSELSSLSSTEDTDSVGSSKTEVETETKNVICDFGFLYTLSDLFNSWLTGTKSSG